MSPNKIKKKRTKFNFEPAFDVKKRIFEIVDRVEEFKHIDAERVFCFRSEGSTSRAIARVWSLPRIWQRALSVEPHYVIEVITRRFDKLNEKQKEKVLIHELMHLPKTFSGSLVPHRCFGKKIDSRSVEKIYLKYKSK